MINLVSNSNSRDTFAHALGGTFFVINPPYD